MKKHVAVGIDIGGTKVEAIALHQGKVLHRIHVPTPVTSAKLRSCLKDTIIEFQDRFIVRRVGAASTGIVNQSKGVVERSDMVPAIERMKLKNLFESLGVRRVLIDNDANAFAEYQRSLGKARKFDSFVAITLGTAVGVALVIDRHVYRGAHNCAGESGHIFVDLNKGFLASYSKAKTAADFKGVAKMLGKGLATFVNLLDPEALVLGGTVSHKQSKVILSEVPKEMQKHVLSTQARPKLIISRQTSAGAIGAALLTRN